MTPTLRADKRQEILNEIGLLLVELEDLHVQATRDRSHFYTGTLVRRTIELLIQAQHWLQEKQGQKR